MTFARLIIFITCCLAALPVAAAGLTPSTPPRTASSVVTAKGVTLNLRDVDIRDLIDAVSKATGINFVVDPRVRGKVTVISSAPMPRDALYRVFLSVLDVYGYTAVPDGQVVKIIPSAMARQNTLLQGKGAEIVTRVVRVKNMSAAQMVPMLRPLVAQQGLLAAYPPSNMLIITDRAANVRRIVQLIHDLDRPENNQIEIVKLKHASATDVARILESLLQQQSAKGTPASAQARVIADSRSNSVLISANAATRKRLRVLITELDAPLPSTGDSHVVFLKYARAKDVAELLKTIVHAQQPEKTQTKPPASSANIQADESINALVITAPEQQARQLMELARQLDVRPAEVMIEAVIAEVSSDLANELGTQVAVVPSQGDKIAPAAVLNFTNGPGSLVTLASNPAAVGPGLFFGFADLRPGQTRYGLLLNALRSNAGTDILSTPSLLTLDNKEAEIVVGKNVPFITGKYATTTSDTTGTTSLSSPFQTIERRDVGITLKVTPQINQGENVRLKIDLNVSSLAPSVSGAADLITNTRQIKTSVITGSGSIIVLGGLIDDSYQKSRQKVPLLGDIPGLGLLFSSTSRQRTKTNLMIFLHPVIINNQSSADVYTRQKYDFLRQQQLYNKHNNKIGSGSVLPPNLRDNFTVKVPMRTGSASPNKAPVKHEPSTESSGRWGQGKRMCLVCG